MQGTQMPQNYLKDNLRKLVLPKACVLRGSMIKFAQIIFKIHQRNLRSKRGSMMWGTQMTQKYLERNFRRLDSLYSTAWTCRFGSAQRPESLPMTQPDFLIITHSKDFTLVVSTPLDDFRASLNLRSQSLRC